MILYVCVHTCIYVYYKHDIHLLRRSDQQHIIGVAATNNVSAVRSAFDSVNWSEESYRWFERIGLTADHVHYCFSSVDSVSLL